MTSRSTIPLTIYDVFGYLIPGSVLVMGSIVANSINYLPKLVGDLLQSNVSNADIPRNLIWHMFKLVETAPIFTTVVVLLVFYLVGHMVSTASSFIVEWVFTRNIFGYPIDNMLSDRQTTKWPFRSYRRPYSEPFKTNLRTGLCQHFNLDESLTRPSDIWQMAFVAVEDQHSTAYARAIHFLTLYGFNRNMAVAIALLIPSLVLSPCLSNPIKVIAVIVCLVVATGFYWQYLKSFRRMTDEVVRTIYYYHVHGSRSYNYSVTDPSLRHVWKADR